MYEAGGQGPPFVSRLVCMKKKIHTTPSMFALVILKLQTKESIMGVPEQLKFDFLVLDFAQVL